MIRALLLLCFIGTGALAQSVHETSAGPVQITPIVTRLIEPWAVGFVPGGGLLITERSGRLLYGSDGQLSSVSGVPEVWARGQGGLLDVVVARDFATTSEVFLSFSEPDGNGASGTALAVARFDSAQGGGRRWHAVFDHWRPTSAGSGARYHAPQRERYSGEP